MSTTQPCHPFLLSNVPALFFYGVVSWLLLHGNSPQHEASNIACGEIKSFYVFSTAFYISSLLYSLPLTCSNVCVYISPTVDSIVPWFSFQHIHKKSDNVDEMIVVYLFPFVLLWNLVGLFLMNLERDVTFLSWSKLYIRSTYEGPINENSLHLVLVISCDYCFYRAIL